jgi:hypothetical protein
VSHSPDAEVWRHRIAVLEDIDADDVEELAFLSGVVRHEIEHAKQRTISAATTAGRSGSTRSQRDAAAHWSSFSHDARDVDARRWPTA